MYALCLECLAYGYQFAGLHGGLTPAEGYSSSSTEKRLLVDGSAQYLAVLNELATRADGYRVGVGTIEAFEVAAL